MRTVNYTTKNGNNTTSYAQAKVEGIKATNLVTVEEPMAKVPPIAPASLDFIYEPSFMEMMLDDEVENKWKR